MRLMKFESWDEFSLMIFNNIIMIMPIEEEAFLVRDISKAFMMQPSSRCCQRNTMCGLQVNSWK